MSNSKNSYPNKKDVEFKPENIGNIYQTDNKLVYFEKHYRQNFNTGNYDDYVVNSVIYYGMAVSGKTYRLCELVSQADNLIILSFTNKAVEKVKSVFRKLNRPE